MLDGKEKENELYLKKKEIKYSFVVWLRTLKDPKRAQRSM